VTHAPGIVHFGPGAFHRAHQGDFIDRLLRDDPRWGIAAASLRSAGTVEKLKRQNGRYTLAILDEQPAYRTLHAHREWFGPEESVGLRARLRHPATRLVTATVTEKGHCLAADGTLDFGHPDILHDLAAPNQPHSLIGWLALALADRHADREPPFATITCDNMASNGRKLAAAVTAFAQRIDADLARWIEGEARFPDTMVDAITPATTDDLRARVAAATGWRDAAPVCRESYAAWVIEDVLPGDGPDLAAAGAILTSNVAAWEQAKLRLLNGAHSTLAYAGLMGGHETVAAAMDDPVLAAFVERMMREDIAATLTSAAPEPQRYIEELLQRFRNPAIGHKLSQIAWDGSQKLPYRLLDTLTDLRRSGRPIHRIALAIAAWMAFIRRQAQAGAPIVDPLAEALTTAGRGADPARALLEMTAIFPPGLASDALVRGAILDAIDRIDNIGVHTALAATMEEAQFA